MINSLRERRLDRLERIETRLEDEIYDAESEVRDLKEKMEIVKTMIEELEVGGDPDESELGDCDEQIGEGNPLTDDESEIINTLLTSAQLTGVERDDLEEMLEEDELSSKRLQEIMNSHLATIHAHQ